MSLSTIDSLYTSIQGSLIIIGVIYLIAIILIKKFNAVTIFIHAGIVSLFFINNLVVLLLILGSINVLQGIYLLYKKELNLGLKNFSFGYFFILMAIPDSPEIMAVGIVLLLSIKFLTISFEQEILDPILFFSNIATAAIAILKFQSHIVNGGLLSVLLILLIAFSIIRFLTTKSIDTMLYILPQLLCAAVLAPPIYVALALVYIFCVSTLNMAKNKAVQLLDLLPYLDSTLFMVIVSTLISKCDSQYHLIVGIVLFVLLVLSSMKSFEKYFKYKNPQSWTNVFIVLFLASILIVFTPVILESRFELYQPVPVFLSIFIIIIEARYLALFQRIRVVPISKILLKFFEFIYMIFDKIIKLVVNAFLIIKNLVIKIIKAVMLFLVYFLGIIPRLFILYVNRRPSTSLHKKITSAVEKFESYFYKHLHLEELISLAIILILLMFFLGDF